MIDPGIRLANPADLGRMVAVEVAAAGQFPLDLLPPSAGRSGSPVAIQAAIDAGTAWVAEAGERGVVGFVAAQAVGEALHIVEMDVDPAFGRRGIGTALLEHAVAQCRALGLCAVTLTTFATVRWNAPFYARRGFRVVADTRAFPHLAAALAREAALGLTDRVAMRREVG